MAGALQPAQRLILLTIAPSCPPPCAEGDEKGFISFFRALPVDEQVPRPAPPPGAAPRILLAVMPCLSCRPSAACFILFKPLQMPCGASSRRSVPCAAPFATPIPAPAASPHLPSAARHPPQPCCAPSRPGRPLLRPKGVRLRPRTGRGLRGAHLLPHHQARARRRPPDARTSEAKTSREGAASPAQRRSRHPPPPEAPTHPRPPLAPRQRHQAPGPGSGGAAGRDAEPNNVRDGAPLAAAGGRRPLGGAVGGGRPRRVGQDAGREPGQPVRVRGHPVPVRGHGGGAGAAGAAAEALRSRAGGARALSPRGRGSLGVLFGAGTGRAAAPPPCAHTGSGGASAAGAGAPPQVGVAYLDAVGRQLGAAEFTDDEASCPGF